MIASIATGTFQSQDLPFFIIKESDNWLLQICKRIFLITQQWLQTGSDLDKYLPYLSEANIRWISRAQAASLTPDQMSKTKAACLKALNAAIVLGDTFTDEQRAAYFAKCGVKDTLEKCSDTIESVLNKTKFTEAFITKLDREYIKDINIQHLSDHVVLNLLLQKPSWKDFNREQQLHILENHFDSIPVERIKEMNLEEVPPLILENFAKLFWNDLNEDQKLHILKVTPLSIPREIFRSIDLADIQKEIVDQVVIACPLSAFSPSQLTYISKNYSFLFFAKYKPNAFHDIQVIPIEDLTEEVVIALSTIFFQDNIFNEEQLAHACQFNCSGIYTRHVNLSTCSDGLREALVARIYRSYQGSITEDQAIYFVNNKMKLPGTYRIKLLELAKLTETGVANFLESGFYDLSNISFEQVDYLLSTHQHLLKAEHVQQFPFIWPSRDSSKPIDPIKMQELLTCCPFELLSHKQFETILKFYFNLIPYYKIRLIPLECLHTDVFLKYFYKTEASNEFSDPAGVGLFKYRKTELSVEQRDYIVDKFASYLNSSTT